MKDIEDSKNTILKLKKLGDLFIKASSFTDDTDLLLKKITDFLLDLEEKLPYQKFVGFKNQLLKKYQQDLQIKEFVEVLGDILFKPDRQKISDDISSLISALNKYKIKPDTKYRIPLDFSLQDQEKIQELGKNLSTLYDYFKEIADAYNEAHRKFRYYLKQNPKVTLPKSYYDYFSDLLMEEDDEFEKKIERDKKQGVDEH